jgi:hypothetical protein
VTRVRPDDGLDLHDLWTHDAISVQDGVAAYQIVQGNLLIARVVPGELGVPVIDGFAYVLPAKDTGPLLERLKAEHRELTREHPSADLATFFKHAAMVPFHHWLDRVALRSKARRR